MNETNETGCVPATVVENTLQIPQPPVVTERT